MIFNKQDSMAAPRHYEAPHVGAGGQTDLRARSDRGPGRRLIVGNAPGEKLDGLSTEVAGCTGDENFGHTFGPKSLVSLDRESGKVGRVKSAPQPPSLGR